ncbi:MAG: NAD(P)H-hydrate dehydratase [Candidatus Gracilibacteria bacterium]|nr:NAD(P)H-hydrate dehydratase [Candidatus Gracilibacteria bacterium]
MNTQERRPPHNQIPPYVRDFKDLKQKIGIGEVKSLQRPQAKSHKGDNGKLLILGGSAKYHGAPLLAAKIASKIVDLVYFSSTEGNTQLLQKMKSKLCEFIAVPQAEILETAKKVDAILIGPGMKVDKKLTALIKKLPKIPIVLDAGALVTSHLPLITSHYILTPHQQEFKRLFGLSATKENLREMAKKYNCTIVLKGPIDYVANAEKLKLNRTGNAGMTKGGTGDVLAGLIASLACKNEPFLAASAGVFLNGLAAQRLAKKVSTHFNASDLIEEIPRTMKYCENF